MKLPIAIKVRISSEEAGLIALTPVVVQDLPSTELVALILGIARKDANRVGEILERGSLVVGGSRFRWEPLRLEREEVQSLLRQYPDSDPIRTFSWPRCKLVQIRGIYISTETASRKRLLRRTSFWSAMQQIVSDPAYIEYSYKERADVFRAFLSESQQSLLREAADLLTYPTLANQIRNGNLERMELLVLRLD